MTDDEMPEGYFLDRNDEATCGKFHGPVDLKICHDGTIWQLEFTGGEEGDVLHTAADWINSRRYAVVKGIAWLGDVSDEVDEKPTVKMRMFVAMDAYRRR